MDIGQLSQALDFAYDDLKQSLIRGESEHIKRYASNFSEVFQQFAHELQKNSEEKNVTLQIN